MSETGSISGDENLGERLDANERAVLLLLFEDACPNRSMSWGPS